MSARQNYHVECEEILNECINVLLNSAYVNESLAVHFDRCDVALKGFHNFFQQLNREHVKQADKLMEYQNKRGGRVILQNIGEPNINYWDSGRSAMESSLALEKTINQQFLKLAACGKRNGDPQLIGFLKKNVLGKQVENMKKISNYINNLNQVGCGLGEYMFDHETLQH
ncbi:soma ferritin-like [Argonauta hians]